MIRRAAALAALAALLMGQQASAAFFAFAGGAFTYQTEQSAIVPNVIGKVDVASAEIDLISAGLVLAGSTTRCSAATVNSVIGQSPAPGETVALGSGVALLVSNGVACVQHGRPGVRLKGLRMPGV